VFSSLDAAVYFLSVFWNVLEMSSPAHSEQENVQSLKKKKKSKAIPVTGRGGL
jgi:hypothetical protein